MKHNSVEILGKRVKCVMIVQQVSSPQKGLEI